MESMEIMLCITVVIIIYLLYTKKKGIEGFDNTEIEMRIKEEINKQYNMDIEAIRNLGAISKSLLTGTNYHSTTPGTPGTLTIPANVIIEGNISVAGNSAIDGNSNISGSLSYLPIGTIIIWSGAANAVPDGWALCDGANGTPNLTGRFVLGTGTVDATKENNSPYHTNNYREKKPYNQNLEFTMGKTGGQDMQKITTNQMPSHSHKFKFTSGSGTFKWWMNHGIITRSDGDDAHRTGGSALKVGGTDTKTNMGNIRIHDTGSSIPINNMPPYYVLAYIMRIR